MNTQKKTLRSRLTVAAAAALALGLAAASPAAAQQTFYACYVPDVGAVYLIKIPGLPDACLSGSHVEVSWTEGGEIADGSVTTAKLADGSVTTAKIAANAVTSAAVAANTLTAADLAASSVGSSEIASGAVTSAKLDNTLSISGQFSSGSVSTPEVVDLRDLKTITDLEIVLEEVDNPSVFSFFEVFHTSGFPIFFVNEAGSGGFSGNLSVTGSVSKGSGSFRIDHPLDPENMYLSHSFVESPDMMNVYNGNVTLDEQGTAWVELPDYFEVLNRDYRYQLTPPGAAAPDLHIAREISGNRFMIAGGQPGMRVSWQVTGVRDDPFARMNPIRVEEAKPPAERGSLLHPEAYKSQ
jgi:hypothetical protein